ncbi:MAG: putative mariner transposase [Streblomastix strix]|uniref:Putative mariner transposase n=1 Tax=Streblomastix strix TaxID=222440 RepID=A0A5J4WDC1_9EUKA|nr:MAG: putative mariner transposase [Streblomastix strix]
MSALTKEAKERNRVVADFLFRIQWSSEDIYEQLKNVYTDSYPELKTVKSWKNQFISENMLRSPLSPPGCPPIVGLGEIFNHDHKTIHEIILRETTFRLVCFRWVPNDINRVQKLNRIQDAFEMRSILNGRKRRNFHRIYTGDESYMFYINVPGKAWVLKGQQAPEWPRAMISDKKLMPTVFCSSEKIVLTHWMLPNQRMTAVQFTEEIFKPLNKIVRKECKGDTEKPWIHYDNARVHTAHYTQEFLAKSVFQRMPQPAYSPDLAPSDFFLFGYIKTRLKGKKFFEENELKISVEEILVELTPEQLSNAFEGWINRLTEICVNHDYLLNSSTTHLTYNIIQINIGSNLVVEKRDFGLAKEIASRNYATVVVESDVFAVSEIIFKLLSGRHPFESDSEQGMIDNIIQGKMIKFPAFAEGNMKQIVLAMMNPNPSRRPSAKAVLADDMVRMYLRQHESREIERKRADEEKILADQLQERIQLVEQEKEGEKLRADSAEQKVNEAEQRVDQQKRTAEEAEEISRVFQLEIENKDTEIERLQQRTQIIEQEKQREKIRADEQEEKQQALDALLPPRNDDEDLPELGPITQDAVIPDYATHYCLQSHYFLGCCQI